MLTAEEKYEGKQKKEERDLEKVLEVRIGVATMCEKVREMEKRLLGH